MDLNGLSRAQRPRNSGPVVYDPADQRQRMSLQAMSAAEVKQWVAPLLGAYPAIELDEFVIDIIAHTAATMQRCVSGWQC